MLISSPWHSIDNSLNATAQFDLGQAYQLGVGVSKDMIHARYWLERADAAEAAPEAIRRPAPAKAEFGIEPRPPSRRSDSCRPLRPPIYAMRKNDVREVTGVIAAYIDIDGRVRGVTASRVSLDALKYDVVALFSTSLRSPECILTDHKRGRKIEIPFKLVMQ